MKHILEMIEAVDPSDTAKMDEIDALVWCYYYREVYGFNTKTSEHCFENEVGGLTPIKARKARKYTRSRDALKAIRPDGWVFEISECDDGTKSTGWMANICQLWPTRKLIWSKPHRSPTEELAELHAILQAIAHEREGK